MNCRPIIIYIMAWFGLFASCNKKAHTSATQSVSSALANNQSVNPQARIDSLAKQYLKTDYKVAYNGTKTAALIFRVLKNRPQSIHGTVSFVLYHLPSDKVLLRETVPQASIAWVDDTHIQVSQTPGIIAGDKAQGMGYLFDIEARKKQPLKK